jgi:glycosyltransferase involved in cell wall biosynthesis
MGCRMRIVHLVQSLAIGGQEMLIVSLSRELARRGHIVTVVALTPGGALARELGDDVEVVELDRREGFDLRLYVQLARVFRQARIEVLHTHNASPLIYGGLPARLLGARVVHTKHGVGAVSGRTRALLRAAAPLAAAWVCVSDETARLAREREGAPAARVVVLRNGVAVDAFAPSLGRRAQARAALGAGASDVVIGTVGRLVPEKNHALLIEAVARLRDPHVRLVIVGDGPLRSETERAVSERLGPRGRVLGPRRDVAELLAGFDVFALSSDTEGVPLAVLEAQAAHLPVVATAVGGLPGVVPADAGSLVPKGDAGALERELHRRVSDAGLRQREGLCGHASVAARFSLEAMVTAYEQLYAGAAPASP